MPISLVYMLPEYKWILVLVMKPLMQFGILK